MKKLTKIIFYILALILLIICLGYFILPKFLVPDRVEPIGVLKSDISCLSSALQLYFVDHEKYIVAKGKIKNTLKELEPKYISKLPNLNYYGEWIKKYNYSEYYYEGDTDNFIIYIENPIEKLKFIGEENKFEIIKK
ncbi:hypothetical protein KA977_12215 [Candidatus Dependentiae bacterium]|nr:hypothetical protein [Candidatus Dependentiae bacterium]